MDALNNSPAVLGDNEDDNYRLFLTQVHQSGQIWGLYSEEGWAVCPSIEYEETDVFPFWSDKRYAAALCTEEWSSYEPRAITLEDFLAEWLPGMHEDDVLVGPNWDAEMTGLEMEPADLAQALDPVEE